MGAYTGKMGWGAMGLESTPGTKANPVVYIPYEDITDDSEPKVAIPNEHRGTIDDAYNAVRTGVNGKQGFKQDIFPEMGLEYAAYGIFGKKSVVADGAAYKHTFEVDNIAPTFTIWSGLKRQQGVAETNTVPRFFTGCMMDSLKLAFKDGETAKMEYDFLGSPQQLDTADKTPVYAEDPVPFVFPDLSFKVVDWNKDTPGTPLQDTKIQDLEFEIKKSVKEETTGNNSLSPSVRMPTGFELTGKFAKIFEDQADLKEFMGSASATQFSKVMMFKNVLLDVTGQEIPGVTGKNYSIKLYLPKIYFAKHDVKYSGDDILKQSFDFRALRDVSLTTPFTAKMEVTNALASIT